MSAFLNLLDGVLDATMMLLALAILTALIASVVLYVIDVTQNSQAIRRNYPLIGRQCCVFEHLGFFFRQHFFAMDREELSFNHAQRAWVARAAKKLDSTISFGSTKPLNRLGDIFSFRSAFLPTKEEIKAHVSAPLVFGESFVREPYAAPSIFNISAMSYVALSGPAIEPLSMGAAASGVWLNTGESGPSPFHQTAAWDLVFQIGTAEYDMQSDDGNLDIEKIARLAAIPRVRMFEIKLSQGAKPGKGGVLPAEKITDLIATTRGIPSGKDSVSPNRHPEVTDADSLLDLIDRVRIASGKPVGIKLVLGQTTWQDIFCDTIHAWGPASAPDFITLESSDGGTGTTPQALLDNMGLPWPSAYRWWTRN